MSVTQPSLLVLLVLLIDQVFHASPVALPRKRGRPHVYGDALFYKALVMMVVRRLTSPHEFFQVLNQPTVEMQTLRALLTHDGTPTENFPCRRTWKRRLDALPQTLPDQIALLGRFLVEQLQPFARSGRAVAIDSTLLRAFGGFVWHKKDKDAGVLPHSGIDIEAAWTKSGHHGWVYGWKLHLIATCGEVWIPLAASLTPAHEADNQNAPDLLAQRPACVRFVLGDTHYNAPQVRDECALRGLTLVASGHGKYPHPDQKNNAKEVRKLLHKLRSVTIENFNQQFKSVFDAHRPVPVKGKTRTQIWALGAIGTYQLLLFHQWKNNLPLRDGLKYALKAA